MNIRNIATAALYLVMSVAGCYFPRGGNGIARRKYLNLTGNSYETSFWQFLIGDTVLYTDIFMKLDSFSSQEIYLKQRSPAGRGKRNNALVGQSASLIVCANDFHGMSTALKVNVMIMFQCIMYF